MTAAAANAEVGGLFSGPPLFPAPSGSDRGKVWASKGLELAARLSTRAPAGTQAAEGLGWQMAQQQAPGGRTQHEAGAMVEVVKRFGFRAWHGPAGRPGLLVVGLWWVFAWQAKCCFRSNTSVSFLSKSTPYFCYAEYFVCFCTLSVLNCQLFSLFQKVKLFLCLIKIIEKITKIYSTK